MRIIAEHSTTYRYNSPVSLDPHTFRLRPRMSSSQWLLAYHLKLLPTPAGSSEGLDQDGNLVAQAWFNGLTPTLTVISSFTVELLQTNPFDYLPGQSWRLPLWYPEPLCAALSPYRNDSLVDPQVRDFAQSIASGVQGDVSAFLTALTLQLFQTSRPLTRPEGPPWAPNQTLQRHEGSCRDLAVLFCDACRVMGIAARFVSGYECSSAGQQNSYMHAWAEVYLPGVGWRGYDPARGLAVADGHVAVAAGFHYDLAAPILGSFSGSVGSSMETSLNMRVGTAAG